MSIFSWSKYFEPELPRDHQISLGEGNTPCVPSRSIGPALGFPNLFFKLETSNPSGSYKDRFAALAVSYMRWQGQSTCLATSSGNTGAALAAYCAAAGIECRIAVVESAPPSKLQQMLAYGAQIGRIQGFGVDAKMTDDVFSRLQRRAEDPGFALQISAFRWSPLGMQGVETIAHELTEQFGGSIDHVFCPAGGGGLTLAIALGFQKTQTTAAVHCVQPAGNDTIAGPLQRGDATARSVDCSTKISGLQVANVIDGDRVIEACRASGGTGHRVSDEEAFAAQRRLAREEGLFCEPAGAVALAGLIRSVESGELSRDEHAVCLVTGSGFKDSQSIERMNAETACPIVNLADWVG